MANPMTHTHEHPCPVCLEVWGCRDSRCVIADGKYKICARCYACDTWGEARDKREVCDVA